MCDWCLIDVAHPLRLGKKQGEKKVNPGDISHCIVTRFGPLIDIDLVWSAKRGDRFGPRTPLELIVIAERKARINMQQTEREARERGRGKKSELKCRNMRLITEQQSNVATVEPNWECVQRNAYH